MTPTQRQLLYDALMEGTPEDPVIVHEFAQMVDHELDRLTPIIDAMLTAPLASTEWKMTDFLIYFLPDGGNIIVDVIVGGRKFSGCMSREQLRALGQECIRQAGL